MTTKNAPNTTTPSDHGQVVVIGRLDGGRAESGQAEQLLDHDHPAEQAAEIEAELGYGGRERGADHVPQHYPPVSSGPGQHRKGASTCSRMRGMPGRG